LCSSCLGGKTEKMKKIIIISLICLLAGLAGCSKEPAENTKSAANTVITPTAGTKVEAVRPDSEPKKEIIVYVTRTGTRYHRAGCGSLSKTKIAIPLEKARKNYLPCNACHPPK